MASRRCHLHVPSTAADVRGRRAARRRHDRRPVEHLDGGPVTWFVLHRPHHSRPIYRYDARTDDDRRCTPARRARSTCRPCTRSRSPTPRRTAPTSGCSCSRPRRRPTGPRPTILYGYGGFGVPLTPALLRGRSWPGSRPAASTPSPTCAAAARRARTGTAPACCGNKQNVFDDFHAAAEWLVADGLTTADQLGDLRRLQRRPARRRGADPAARPVRRGGLRRRRCSTWSATSEFGLGPTWTDEYGTAEDPEQLGWLLAYSPYHRVRRGHRLPGDAVHRLRRRHPRRPAARPQDVRGAAARHVGHPAGPAAPRGRRRSRRPLAVEVGRGDGRHAGVLRALDGAVVMTGIVTADKEPAAFWEQARDFLLGVPLQILMRSSSPPLIAQLVLTLADPPRRPPRHRAGQDRAPGPDAQELAHGRAVAGAAHAAHGAARRGDRHAAAQRRARSPSGRSPCS